MPEISDYLALGMGLPQVTSWLSGIRVWELDSASGVVTVGCPGRVLLVAQAPSRGGGAPLSGRAGARLRGLLGCPGEADFQASFDAFNLVPVWSGMSGKGDRFPLPLARAVAARVHFRSDRVVLFGGAAEAFGVRTLFQWHPLGSALVAAAPHPSGVNRWWNDDQNQKVAATFFDSISPSHVGRRAC
jgi:uracil-DNA glycosylase